MNLQKIDIDPKRALMYLDRYVNDGSPSGFTEKNKTSEETDTFSLNTDFKLYGIDTHDNNYYIYGELDQNIPLKNNQIYIHPDMRTHKDLVSYKIFQEDSFTVSPTSSFRTVQIISDTCNDFIKLHYDGVIGRINRKLSYMRAIAGVEISGILKDCLLKSIYSNFISIYEEPFAKILINSKFSNKDDNWGMVWRNSKPIGKLADKIKYIIPLFSFWSTDRLVQKTEFIGTQLFELWGVKARDKYISQILIPILDTYFELIVKGGLQNEYNAQNLLIGFDKSWNPISIIIRDMMGIEKDIEIRKSLGLSISFDSSPYKILSPENPHYQIRHSFTFDFKVCYYVIEPLINLAVQQNICKRNEIIELLRERANYWINLLPKDYFPKNKWYSHDKVILTISKNREYIEHKYPMLRD